MENCKGKEVFIETTEEEELEQRQDVTMEKENAQMAGEQEDMENEQMEEMTEKETEEMEEKIEKKMQEIEEIIDKENKMEEMMTKENEDMECMLVKEDEEMEEMTVKDNNEIEVHEDIAEKKNEEMVEKDNEEIEEIMEGKNDEIMEIMEKENEEIMEEENEEIYVMMEKENKELMKNGNEEMVEKENKDVFVATKKEVEEIMENEKEIEEMLEKENEKMKKMMVKKELEEIMEKEDEEIEEMIEKENEVMEEMKKEMEEIMEKDSEEIEELEGGAEMEDRRMIVRSSVYPPLLRSHDELLSCDKKTFVKDLRYFHSAMGTRYMVPLIGGKELDVRLLYTEVTGRGGIEKVIVEGMWRDVIHVFDFPRTTTSASYALRKAYLNLLYHFEQVHYFGAQGPVIAPSAALQTKTPVKRGESSNSVTRRRRKRARRDIEIEGLDDLSFGGRVDGKCDFGYFVTVKIGGKTLKGMIYHPTEQQSIDSSSATDTDNEVNDARRRGRRRTRNHRNWDPNHPKPNRSGYNFFFQEKHAELKQLLPNRERDYIKMIGEAWRNLSENEKTAYEESARADKERYKREMQEYSENARLAQQGKDVADHPPGPSNTKAEEPE